MRRRAQQDFRFCPRGGVNLELSWDEKAAQDTLQFRFEHFTVKVPIVPGGK